MSCPVATAPTGPDWRLRRRQKIVAAAARLFAQRQYLAVQMDEIAQAAGTGKATIYRYFRTKAALYLEIFEGALIKLDEAIAAEVARDRPPPEMIGAIVESVVSAFVAHFRTLSTLLGEEMELADRMRRMFRRRRRAINAHPTDAFERAIARGTLRPFDAEVAPTLLP